MAFYALLALFPAIGALISIWALAFDPLQLEQQIGTLSGVLPPDAAAIVKEQAHKVTADVGGLSLALGIVLALYGAAKGLKAVPGFVWLASTDGNMGRQAEAKAAAAQVSPLNPHFSISAYGGKVPYRDEAVLEQFREGLAQPACRRTLSLGCGVDFVEESALRTELLRLSLVSSAQRAGQAPLPPKSAAIPQGRGRFPYCRQPRRERKVLTCPAGGSMVLRWFAAAIMLAAALCARAADAEIRIGVAGPMTGANAWFGEQYQRGTELAVEDLNANGGVLGQSVELIVGDDFCDPDQAVALARKLVSDGVAFVAGHWCSHSAIPASKVYEDAEIS